MKLILDGIELPIDGIYEHITTGILSASKQFAEGEELPDVSALIGKTEVESVICKDENDNVIDLIGTYSKIMNFTVRYNEIRAYDITLGN